MSLNIQDIEQFVGKNHDQEVIRDLNILAAAINDWPSRNLGTVEDYIVEIEAAILGLPTKGNLEHFLKKLDFQKNAWQAESIAEVLELYRHHNESASLREIVKELERKLRD